MRLSQYPHLFLIANSEVYNYEKVCLDKKNVL